MTSRVIDDALGAKLRQWEEQAVPRREMARRTGISRQTIGSYLGRKPKRERGEARPDHHIYAHHEPFRKAALVAESLGYRLTAGDNAGKGSVGALIEGIGNEEVVVLPKANYDELLFTDDHVFSVDDVPGRLIN